MQRPRRAIPPCPTLFGAPAALCCIVRVRMWHAIPPLPFVPFHVLSPPAAPLMLPITGSSARAPVGEACRQPPLPLAPPKFDQYANIRDGIGNGRRQLLHIKTSLFQVLRCFIALIMGLGVRWMTGPPCSVWLRVIVLPSHGKAQLGFDRPSRSILVSRSNQLLYRPPRKPSVTRRCTTARSLLTERSLVSRQLRNISS
ncbi:hypothetical protein B0J12DRAFT_29276 [Macrophomina phaseolina]|uniref:Secreted protein n=1 Tax=Macrophomina phaseolina TaxID=35725 RepID=A0ABQ8GVH4_9PEZI|nr:hypothetical protein B0J12DRAFT_29276 [Macrophomina phaseolina]